MKKLAFALLLAASVPAAFAETETVDGVTWTYSLSDGKATVDGASTSLTNIEIPTRLGDCPVISIGRYAFNICSRLKSVSIPDGVTSIGIGAFSGCSGLTSITIPDGVTSIASYAFSGCSGLTSIVIPDGVKSVENHAFYGCSGLTSITIPDGVKSIKNDAFSGCSGLTSITIPSGVTSIKNGAFNGCSGLTSITIPSGVTSIEAGAFSDCSGLTSIVVDEDNPFYSSRSNCNAIVRTSDNALIAGCKNTTIPDSVTRIENFAFSGCSGLTSIAIPDGVTSIGDGAFFGCSGLESIAIPDGVTRIGNGTFRGCSGLESIAIPDGVTSIANSAFYDCSELTSISIPDSVKIIDGYAFHGCGFTSIAIPNSVTNLGSGVFSDCSALQSVELGNGIDAISGCLFQDCSRLQSVTIPDGVAKIGDEAFSRCVSLKSVSIPSSVGSIGYKPFEGCYRLSSVSIPGERSIWIFESDNGELPPISEVAVAPGSRLLSNDFLESISGWYPSIKLSVPLPDSVTDVGDLHCYYSGTEPVYNESGTILWYAPVSGSFSVPYGVTNIWKAAFLCSGLTSIDLPSSLKTIGTEAFCECRDLPSAVIPTSVTDIGDALFIYDSSRLMAETNKDLWFPRHFRGQMDRQYIDCWTVHLYSLLSVVSEHGHPGPEGAGVHLVEADAVTNSVEEIAYDATNGVRYVCTGWTGTGSAPASGTGTNVTFAIEEDSTITWNWRTQVLVSVSATGGTCSFGSRWLDLGETATAEIATDFPFFNIRLSGDTEGVTVDGTTLRIPADGAREIAVTVSEAWQVSLSVESEWGLPTPASGIHTLLSGNEYSAVVSEPDPTGGVRYVCTGWTGTGSVPASGTATNATFDIEEDSTITWNWKTQVLVTVTATGGECAFGSRWIDLGGTATAEIVPDTHLFAIALAGDTNGVTLAGTTLTIPADGPRSVEATVTETKLPLAVASEWGFPSPATGSHALSWGAEVSASVEEPEPEEGVRYVCTGWTGTGSVPASGTGTNLAFTIEEASTVTWNWRTQVLVTVSMSGGTCAFGSRWVDLGTMATAEIVPDTQFFRVSLSGDTNGVTRLGKTLSIPADGPRTLFVAVDSDALQSVFRFYSKRYKGHFFTIDEGEKDLLIAHNPNWKYEGVAYRAFREQVDGTVALYRFYSKRYSGHFFTIDEQEMWTVRETNPNWKYEGISFYVYPEEIAGSVPVFRFWSKGYRHHFYTTSEEEKDDLIANNPNWKYECVAFWAMPAEEASPAGARGTMPNARDASSGNAHRATSAAWTLSAADGAAVAVSGVTETGGATIEARLDAPDAEELAALPADITAAYPLVLCLALPCGAFDAELWSAADGTVADETVDGAFDFALPVTGVWHWLRVRDGEGNSDSSDAFSVWLRAE